METQEATNKPPTPKTMPQLPIQSVSLAKMAMLEAMNEAWRSMSLSQRPSEVSER